MLPTSSQPRPRTMDDLLDPALAACASRIDLNARRPVRGRIRGERRSARRGESVEFADHRPYSVGDDLRHIDWNIFGRLDRLFLKLFLHEEDLTVHLVIDASASNGCGEPGKLLFMQRATMAIGYIALANLNRAACTAIAGGSDASATDRPNTLEGPALRTIADLRGRARAHDLARFLCSITPGGSVDFSSACDRIARMRRGRAMTVVLSDMLFKEGYTQGLSRLIAGGHDLAVIQVLSPQELSPGIGGELRLRDLEDRDQAEITASGRLIARYKSMLDAYRSELESFCARRGITLIGVSSDTPMDRLILDMLRRRGVLR